MAVVQEFVFRAVDSHGGAVVKGTVEAASETAVTSKLKAQGLTPLEVSLKSKTGIYRELKMPGISKGVSAKSLAIFARQMAGLLNAGLPLMRALNILIEQTEDKRLQPALVSVYADVESGSSFSAALSRHPDIFPPLLLSIVRAAASWARRSPPSPTTTSARRNCRTRSRRRRPIPSSCSSSPSSACWRW
jgi:type II secretory pathway component PulF